MLPWRNEARLDSHIPRAELASQGFVASHPEDLPCLFQAACLEENLKDRVVQVDRSLSSLAHSLAYLQRPVGVLELVGRIKRVLERSVRVRRFAPLVIGLTCSRPPKREVEEGWGVATNQRKALM